MQVRTTWIVYEKSKGFRPLYECFNGIWFITDIADVFGLTEVNKQRAQELISNTEI